MASRSLFAFLSIIFVAGALAMMFFIALAGATNASPLNKFYFMEVGTDGIPGFGGIYRYTFWNLCPVDANGNNNCGSVHPAFPLDPTSPRNFNTNQHNVPTNADYFYMTRFMFAFMLIALFFGVCTFFTGVLALCTRLGSYLSGLLAFVAMFFQTIVAALMTSAYVLARDKFRQKGRTADIGDYAFGLEWAAWACLLIATVLFCMGGKGKGKKDTASSTTYPEGRRSFFGGKRDKNDPSRGSFIEGNDTSADKEYA